MWRADSGNEKFFERGGKKGQARGENENPPALDMLLDAIIFLARARRRSETNVPISSNHFKNPSAYVENVENVLKMFNPFFF